MKLLEMITTLRTIQFERVEIRDAEGNEMLTCPTVSNAFIPFGDYEVIEWFPHGTPNKDKNVTFTVYIKKGV